MRLQFMQFVMLSKNLTMSGNVCSSSGTLILIKDSSRNPLTIDGLVIRGNTLRCPDAVCTALTYDAARMEFVDNTIENGIVSATFYNADTTIAGNHFHFGKPVPAGAAAITWAPIEFGQEGVISGNWVISVAPQPAGATCIAASWTDFNVSDRYMITGNHCEGAAPFLVDLSTTTAGGNPGPHASWMIAGN